mgnify:CR=1 FL=1
MKRVPRVLIIATSRRTRGGITAVVKAHEKGEQWKKYHCVWIQTHRDGPAWRKIFYFVTALLEYLIFLPFYDIVHIHLSTVISAKRKIIFFDIAKLFHKKTILHFHPSNEKFLFQPDNQKLYYNIFSRSDLVLVLSKQWQLWVKESLNLTEHIEVLYNPCPIIKFIPTVRHKEILFAGTLIPRKGYEELIRAFAKIAPRYQDWKVVFAGNGETERAKSIAVECGIESQVYFLGWVSGADKKKAFQSASIYCLASHSEGFPMGVLDAWAYGVPCVVTPVGGLPDIVVNEKNALVFPIGSIDILASQLEKMIDDEQLRKRIAENSRHLALSTFNLNVICNQLDTIYSSLS